MTCPPKSLFFPPPMPVHTLPPSRGLSLLVFFPRNTPFFLAPIDIAPLFPFLTASRPLPDFSSPLRVPWPAWEVPKKVKPPLLRLSVLFLHGVRASQVLDVHLLWVLFCLFLNGEGLLFFLGESFFFSSSAPDCCLL